MTKAQTFAALGRVNSIGFLRLTAASAVIVGHSFPFGGFGIDPLIRLTDNQLAIGRIAVDIFFCLSGYLIAMSFSRSPSWLVFAWHRFLRIYPAFLVCIAITGLILGLLIANGADFHYFLHNAPIITGVIDTIPGMFTNIPAAGSVNGALWTLPWEIRAYFILGLFGVLGVLRRRWLVLIAFLLCWAYFVVKIYSYPGLATSVAVTSGPRLLTFFLAGTVFYLYRHSIPIRWQLFVAAVAIMVGGTVVGVVVPPYSAGVFYAIAPIPLTYATMYLGMRLSVTKINSINDRSYGIYIYGTLILSLMTYFGINKVFGDKVEFWNWFVYTGLTFIATFAAATLSWFVIEKPALSLKDRRPWQRGSNLCSAAKSRVALWRPGRTLHGQSERDRGAGSAIKAGTVDEADRAGVNAGAPPAPVGDRPRSDPE